MLLGRGCGHWYHLPKPLDPDFGGLDAGAEFAGNLWQLNQAMV